MRGFNIERLRAGLAQQAAAIAESNSEGGAGTQGRAEGWDR